MKYTIISLLLLACQSLSAQHILNHEANAPHVGDRLKPLHVELPKDAFDEEQHLWDFSRMQSLEVNSRQRYVMTGDSAKQRTARIENGQRTYYNIKGIVIPNGKTDYQLYLAADLGQGTPTGIDSVVKTCSIHTVVYDLQGRRILGEPVKKGVYLRGGKKYVRK